MVEKTLSLNVYYIKHKPKDIASYVNIKPYVLKRLF